MKYFFIASTILIIIANTSQADTWIDPTWEEMLNESDVIAFVEVTEGGVFKAKVKPYELFKGKNKFHEWWIGGFSNKYGPLDTLKAGEKYCVFLKETKSYKSRFTSSSGFADSAIMNVARKSFVDVTNSDNGFLVWTPTAGELLIEGDSIHFDLLTTSQSNYSSLKPLEEFKEFIRSAIGKANKEYHEQLIIKLSKATQKPKTIPAHQYLMMLHLTNNKKYYTQFDALVEDPSVETKFALARHLGNIKSDKATELLIEMLNDTNSVVQGEVVRQLSEEKPGYIGPILLEHLHNSGEEGLYPSGLMDPVRNQLDGGKMEIIRALGALKYKPAEKKLLPLLETENRYLFLLTLETLKKLGSDDYMPYVIEHIKKGTSSFFLQLCRIVEEEKSEKGKQALMRYISVHKDNRMDYEFALSYLGAFNDEEVKKFLLEEFSNLISESDSTNTDFKESWIKEYIATFKTMQCKEARPLIYKGLFYWSGLNMDFANHPELFTIKQDLEDSLNNKVFSILEHHKINDVKSIAFIQNTKEVVNGELPEVDYIIHVTIDYEQPAEAPDNNEIFSDSKPTFNLIEEVQTELSNKLSISKKNISANSGMYYSQRDERLTTSRNSPIFTKFYDYVIAMPHQSDLIFLNNLLQSGYMKREFDKKRLKETIKKIDDKLKIFSTKFFHSTNQHHGNH